MILNKKNIWNDCLENIKISVSPAIFSTWFSNTHLTKLDKEGERISAEIACPSSFVKATIESRYFGLIQDTLSDTLKLKCDTTFVVKNIQKEPSGKESTPLFDEKKEVRNNQEVILKSKLRSNFTFDNFAVSSSNQMAWAAAEAISKNPGSAYNPLLIWGGVGVGKTHLMNAVGIEILKASNQKKVLFCTAEDFTNDIVEGIRKKTTQEFRNKYRKLDALLIDDIQFIAGKDAVQEEFFHTFNALVSTKKQVILTSDRPPHEISKLEERLRSRFEAGLIVDIANPNFELRCAIIQIKSKEKDLPLTMELVQLIAGNIDSPRRIEGFITKIDSEMKLKKDTPLNEDTIKNLLGKDTTNNVIKKTTPQEMLKVICNHYSLGKRALLGNSRVQTIVLPRQVFMYLLRIQLGIPLQEIGRIVGGRDHTTVMHAVDKITTLASDNVQIREDIRGIKNSL